LTGQAEAPRVLFLCTHNSARSQMAEGLLRSLAGGEVDVQSAGTVATSVRPKAIQAMREIDIDIRGHTSKSLGEFVSQPFDYVITVCDEANESCPFFPNARVRLHWSVEDPSKAQEPEDEKLDAFRQARDVLRGRIEDELLPALGSR